MDNANVVKNDNTVIRHTELTGRERSKLIKSITGHGKLKSALSSMELNPLTVRRAAAGMRVKTESADKIRKFLNSL